MKKLKKVIKSIITKKIPRRAIIEKAAIHIHESYSRIINIKSIYKKYSLLFDKKNKKFGRVLQSKINHLKIKYISSGTSAIFNQEKNIFDKQKNTKALKNNNKYKKKEKSKNKIEQFNNTSKCKHNKLLNKKNNETRDNTVSTKIKQEDILQNIINNHSVKLNINPKIDPNKYIQEKFQNMNNKELAKITGFSEHTIRRKLGEWRLKRQKKSK